jgi:hypothetical protein
MRSLGSVIWFAFGLFSAATVVQATPISVDLMIPNAHGTMGNSPGPGIPFTAPSVTFHATGDTSTLHSTAPGVLAFAATVTLYIPGIGGGTVTAPLAATVSIENVGPADGLLRLSWLILDVPPVFQGVTAQDPSLRDFSFQSSFGLVGVTAAQTYSGFPTGGQVYSKTDNGQTAVVGAGPSGGVLYVLVGTPATTDGPAIPTLTRGGTVTLIGLIAMLAFLGLRRYG